MQTHKQTVDLNNFNGLKLKMLVRKSGFTKEQVVAHVQDIEVRFSLAGLDRAFRGVLPRRNAGVIFSRLAEKLSCEINDFKD